MGLPRGLPTPLPPTQLPTLRPLQPPSLTETSRGSSLVSWAKVRASLLQGGLLWGEGAPCSEPTHMPPHPPVCTQLLVSRPDEENITSYLQLLEKCLSHEVGSRRGGGGHRALHCIPPASWPPLHPQAFTETQKKRLLSWKQQVLKLLRAFPKKVPLDGQGYRPPKG